MNTNLPKQSVNAFKELVANITSTVRFLWQTDHKLTIISFVLETLDRLQPVATAYLIKLIIDQITLTVSGSILYNQALQQVTLLVGGLLAVNILSALISNVAQVTGQIYREKVLNRVNYALIEVVNNLEIKYLEDSAFYDKYSKVQRNSNYRPIRVLNNIIEIFGELVQSLSFIIAIIAFNPLLVLLLFASSLPILLFDFLFAKKIYFVTDNRVPESRFISYLSGALFNEYNAKEMRIYGLHKYFYKLYKQITEKFFIENIGIQKSQGIKRTFIELLSLIAYYLVYIYTALKALAGAITLGSFSFYTQAFSSINRSLRRIFRAFSELYENNLYLTDLYEFINMQPNKLESNRGKRFSARNLTIQVKDLCFKYPGSEKFVLKNINLTVSPGESIAIVGKNGAGKTTLVKLISGLYEPIEGEILVNGVPISEINIHDYRKHIGLIFQDFSYFHFKVKDNIGFGDLTHKDNMQAIKAAAKKAGAEEFIEQLPNKYNQQVGKLFEGGTNFSIGQFQKLALARAFMKNAPLLILDEPTASSDPEAELKLFKQLIKTAKHQALILISHRFSTVKIAQKIYVIDNGRIVEQGSHAELMKRNGVYAKLYSIQAEGYRD